MQLQNSKIQKEMNMAPRLISQMEQTTLQHFLLMIVTDVMATYTLSVTYILSITYMTLNMAQ